MVISPKKECGVKISSCFTSYSGFLLVAVKGMLCNIWLLEEYYYCGVILGFFELFVGATVTYLILVVYIRQTIGQVKG